MPVSKCGQNGGNDRSQLVVESWNFVGVSLIKKILMYLEMIFGKNKEQTTRQLQFKFDLLPPESAGICLFHQRWIKTFYTQPFGQLCTKYGLVFQKNDLVQFCNNYLGGPSQKNLLPAKPAEICLFHERWIKKNYTQPFCQLCIKYVLVFQKIDLVQFCNNYLEGPSQKKTQFGHSENGK